MRNLRTIDLNLLVTLEALLTERNVTRAAQRLHLSQPSVSVRLNKLRRIFGDQLLLPGPRGMLPTARALKVLEPLRDVLAELASLLESNSEFDPTKARLTWQVACADYSEQAILLPILANIRDLAPNARIAIHALRPTEVAKLTEAGTVDLALMTTDVAPQALRRKVLFKERYVLVARRGHPALKQPMTLARFCGLDYVVVSPEGGGFSGATDSMLEAQGRKRTVSVSVPHFLFVPELLRSSNMAAMLPSRLLRGGAHGLEVLEPPLPVPGFEMAMVWHERSHQDPAHRWLRDRIEAAVSRSL